MERFLMTLIHLSLMGTLLAGALALTGRLLGERISRAAMYYLWLLVLLRLCIPLGVSVPLPGEAVRGDQTVQEVHQVPPAPDRGAAVGQSGASAPAGLPEGTGAGFRPGGAGDAGPEEVPVSAGPNWGALLSSPVLWMGIWGAGAAVCLGRYVFGYRRFVRTLLRNAQAPALAQLALLRRLDPRERVGLLVSDAAPSPLLLGVLRPVIVLPSGLTDPGRVWDVLNHELTHHRRHDLPYKWLAAAVTSLHWFNPAMILVRREIARCCELSCDEAVIRSMALNQRRHYGETLLALSAPAPRGAGLLVTTLCEEKRRLKERLVAIVNHRKRGPAALALTALLAAALGACALINGAQPAQTQAPSAPAQTAGQAPRETDTPVQSAPPTPATAERVDGYDLYPLGAWRVAVPAQLSGQLLVFTYEDAVAIYEKASYEQGGAAMDVGWLCSIARFSQLEYEQDYLRTNGGSGGVTFFARDADWYYAWVTPTDVRFYRADGGTQAELENWETLQTTLPGQLSTDFLSRNGLEAFDGDAFFRRDFAWDSQRHYYVNCRTADYAESYTLTLSQPARQGEGGIWCVEQRFDNNYGGRSFILPDTNGLLLEDYYRQVQDQADQDPQSVLLDPEQAARAWVEEGSELDYTVTLLEGEPGGNVYGRFQAVLDQDGTLARVTYVNGRETVEESAAQAVDGGRSSLGSYLGTRLYIRAQAPDTLEGEAIVYTAGSGDRLTFLVRDNLILVEQGDTQAWFTIAYSYTPTPYDTMRETLQRRINDGGGLAG